MADTHHHLRQQSRLGIRTTSTTAGGGGGGGGGGEIVEVQGGHIVRSTGRKDRHSKVCTAKGPRDRRVRLSGHTAIQFYDVQDRLGYDRPSKAVDWLIKKAKAAIDELAELPAWKPTNNNNNNSGEGGGGTATMVDGGLSFLPPSLDSDSIADTIKSFFPMGGSSSAETEAASRAGTTPFQNYSPDLLSRSNNQSQDLRLSLQSFQIPSMLLHQQQNDLFSGTANNPLGGLDGWPDHHHQNHQPSLSAATGEESSKFRRMIPWNNGAETGSSGSGPGSGGGLFVFNTPPLQPNQTAASQSALPLLLQPLFGENQNQFFSQRGPLQSSNTPSIRAWIDPISIPSTTTVNRSHNHQSYQIPSGTIDQSSPFPGYGFASGEFCGFRIPARIHGEEEHDGISDKLSSASSDSRH